MQRRGDLTPYHYAETWTKSYEPQLKHQSNELCHYRSPRRLKVCQNHSSVKVIVILVYYCDCVCYPNALHSSTADHQGPVLSLFYETKPAISFEKEVVTHSAEPTHLMHDNAWSHTALAVTDFFGRWGWELLYHPPYPPDLALVTLT